MLRLKKNRILSRKGLTLVEVLIATVIFSLLVLAAFTMYQPVSRIASMVRADVDAQRVVTAVESYVANQIRNSLSISIFRGAVLNEDMRDEMMSFDALTRAEDPDADPRAIIITQDGGFTYIYNIRFKELVPTQWNGLNIFSDLEEWRVFNRSFYGDISLEVDIDINEPNPNLQVRNQSFFQMQIDAFRVHNNGGVITRELRLDSRSSSVTRLTWIGQPPNVELTTFLKTNGTADGFDRRMNLVDGGGDPNSYVILYHNDINLARPNLCRPDCDTVGNKIDSVFVDDTTPPFINNRRIIPQHCTECEWEGSRVDTRSPCVHNRFFNDGDANYFDVDGFGNPDTPHRLYRCAVHADCTHVERVEVCGFCRGFQFAEPDGTIMIVNISFCACLCLGPLCSGCGNCVDCGDCGVCPDCDDGSTPGLAISFDGPLDGSPWGNIYRYRATITGSAMPGWTISTNIRPGTTLESRTPSNPVLSGNSFVNVNTNLNTPGEVTISSNSVTIDGALVLYFYFVNSSGDPDPEDYTVPDNPIGPPSGDEPCGLCGCQDCFPPNGRRSGCTVCVAGGGGLTWTFNFQNDWGSEKQIGFTVRNETGAPVSNVSAEFTVPNTARHNGANSGSIHTWEGSNGSAVWVNETTIRVTVTATVNNNSTSNRRLLQLSGLSGFAVPPPVSTGGSSAVHCDVPNCGYVPPPMVTFNANGGSVSPGLLTTGPDGRISTLPTPSRSNHTFNGWFTAQTGGTEITSVNHVFTADTILWARWTNNNPTLPNLPVQLATRFTEGDRNWDNTAIRSSTLNITGNGDYTLTINNTGNNNRRLANLDIKAVGYGDFDGGTGSSATAPEEYADAIITITSVTINGTDVSPNASTREHPLVGGHSRDRNRWPGRVNVKLWDAWHANSRTLTNINADGNNYIGISGTPNITTIIVNFAVSGAGASATRTITLNSNGGNAVSPGTRTTDENGRLTAALPTPTRAGHTFDGWFTAQNGGSQVTTGGSGTTFAANATIWARWTQVAFTITLNPNGGNAITPNTRMTDNSGVLAFSELPTPTRGGHSFDGWFTSQTGGTQITSGNAASRTFTSNSTVWARWTPVPANITFNRNHDSGDNTTLHTATTNNMNRATPWPEPPTRTGFIFGGWFDARTGGNERTNTSEFTADATLFARWTSTTRTVTLNRNGGTGGSDSFTATIDSSTLTGYTAPTRSGYTFDGYWSAQTGGSRVITAAGAYAASVVNYTNASSQWIRTNDSTTLWARWTANTYTITLDRNQGTGGAASVTVTFDSANLSGWNTPTRTGYTFTGYWTAATGGTRVLDNGGALVASVSGYTNASRHWTRAENVTLFAQWTQNDTNPPTGGIIVLTPASGVTATATVRLDGTQNGLPRYRIGLRITNNSGAQLNNNNRWSIQFDVPAGSTTIIGTTAANFNSASGRVGDTVTIIAGTNTINNGAFRDIGDTNLTLLTNAPIEEIRALLGIS
jgi:prepilin-type N-terminal cleavage/methylation domain-containing protein/uncharacterized repeat protein (TIGR02543 family)